MIEALNGKEFGGSALRVERSERRDNNAGGNRRGAPNAAGQPQVARKAVNKVVHSDAKSEGAPDPRWAGELSKLKDLLANQKTAYEMSASLVGSEMCIRDRAWTVRRPSGGQERLRSSHRCGPLCSQPCGPLEAGRLHWGHHDDYHQHLSLIHI